MPRPTLCNFLGPGSTRFFCATSDQRLNTPNCSTIGLASTEANMQTFPGFMDPENPNHPLHYFKVEVDKLVPV